MTPRRDYNDLPKWIPAQMQRVGIASVEQLAYRAGGLSRMAIYRWLNDQSRPTTQTMAKICRALDVPLAEGLRQYSEKPNGRPKGSGGGAEGGVKAVAVRERKTAKK
jgi:hypothetical protein